MIEECLVVEFAVTGDDCPLAEATETVGTTVHCDPPLYRRNDTALLRFSATEKADELADTLAADDRIDYLHVSDGDHGTNFRCLSEQFCVIQELIDTGFLAESLEYCDGRGVFSGGVVGNEVLRAVVETTSSAVGVTLERIYQGYRPRTSGSYGNRRFP